MPGASNLRDGPEDRVRDAGSLYSLAAPASRPADRESQVAKADNRPKITLACEDCKRRNYTTTKNKVNDRDRITLRKYCSWCRGHTAHKETR